MGKNKPGFAKYSLALWINICWWHADGPPLFPSVHMPLLACYGKISPKFSGARVHPVQGL